MPRRTKRDKPRVSRSALARSANKRRSPKARPGAHRVPFKANLRSAVRVEEALYRWARWDLMGGRIERALVQVNLDAFAAIEARGRAAPKGETRGITRALIAGANRVRERLVRALAEAPQAPAPLPSAEVKRAYDLVRVFRESIGFAVHDAVPEGQGKVFGLHVPLLLDVPSSVADACDWMASGQERREGTFADGLVTPDEIDRLRRHAKAIRAEQDVLRPPQGEETAAARERRILNLAIEIFYDMYGAAASLWFEHGDPERVRALSLIPRGANRGRR